MVQLKLSIYRRHFLRFLSLELNLALLSASDGEPGLDLDSARLLLPAQGVEPCNLIAIGESRAS